MSDDLQNVFSRKYLTEQINRIKWEVIVIGGGAIGLGIALDAAARGYKTLLLEQSDFTKGTSSRSTKLIHGGVRYLAQGNIKLVFEALREREILLENAPHLVKKLLFFIPVYNWMSAIIYFMGLKVYQWMAGTHSFGKSDFMRASSTKKLFPNLFSKGLKGSITYFDGQFDDSRLGINMAQTIITQGGCALNYFKVTELLKDGARVNGVIVEDQESKKEYSIPGKVVINATGVFAEQILELEGGPQKHFVRPSQGVHLVFDASFLQADSAIMIPKTSDGRVLFIIPWHDKLLVGTTDTLVEAASLEPKALNEEIDFILENMKSYLIRTPKKEDILSIFVGLRPLAVTEVGKIISKDISRKHRIVNSPSGLVTVIGGKWTTYRKIAEETIDLIISNGTVEDKPCQTEDLRIYGYSTHETDSPLSIYGSKRIAIEQLMTQEKGLDKQLSERYPFTVAQVIWAIRYEMARTVEDVLARRLRILFLDAAEAIKMAPLVAQIAADELHQNQQWQKSQVEQFTQLAQQYLHPTPTSSP